MIRSSLAALLCASMITTGCASAARPRVAIGASRSPQDVALLADYVQRIPAGSRVRVERWDGRVIHGTLMQADPDGIVVQEQTRIPESPVAVRVSDLARVSLESASATSVAKSIGIGLAAGAAAALGVFAVIAAMLAD